MIAWYQRARPYDLPGLPGLRAYSVRPDLWAAGDVASVPTGGSFAEWSPPDHRMILGWADKALDSGLARAGVAEAAILEGRVFQSLGDTNLVDDDLWVPTTRPVATTKPLGAP